MEEPLVNGEYLLQKFPGKSGWTYAEIPEVAPDRKAWFNWVRVRGSIDGFELKGCRLMPMGNGRLFLPVRAEIRKRIAKSEGDYVWISLFRDDIPDELPEEFIDCLQAEPPAYDNFLRLASGEQKAYIDWIYSTQNDEIKVERIVKTIDNVLKRQSLRKEKP